MFFVYFRIGYETIFGGISALTHEQMTKINGYSNRYYGWGGEDDDMYRRYCQISKSHSVSIILIRYFVFFFIFILTSCLNFV